MADTKNTKPTLPSQSSMPDSSSVTTIVTFRDNTGKIKKQIAATPAQAANPCPPNATSFLQLQGNGKSQGLEFSGDGFSLVETKPPVPPKNAGKNAVPVVGGPSTNPIYRNIRCGNLLDKTITFKCSLVAGIRLNSCLMKFQLVLQAYQERVLKLAFSWLKTLLPSGDFFEKLAKQICTVANMVQEVVCLIQQVMQCILSTIQFITQLISWVLSLGPALVAQLMACVTNFLSQITNSLSSLTGILAYVLGDVLGCKPYECKQNASVFDITNTAYDLGNSSGKLI